MRTHSVWGHALLAVLTCSVLAACQSAPPNAPPPHTDRSALRVATWNIHYIWLNRDSGRWSRGHWDARKDAALAAFKALDADVVAFQEMESFGGSDDDSVNLARSALLAANPGYAAAAVGDWRRFPSTQPLLYRTDRLTLLDQGWFFFSDTPDRIYSRSFDGGYPAFASWAAFEQHSTQQRFRVVNVHYDFSSRHNRRASTALTVERTRSWVQQGDTVFLVGDLNARLGSDVVATLRDAGFRFADIAGSTYHFNLGLNLFGAIDHIAATPGATLEHGPWVLRQRWDGVWPSDHYPIAADYALNAGAD
ncbi:MAG: endonuclease/exonuclease/phosphatase family protein [Pseudomonadota bacterium]